MHISHKQTHTLLKLPVTLNGSCVCTSSQCMSWAECSTFQTQLNFFQTPACAAFNRVSTERKNLTLNDLLHFISSFDFWKQCLSKWKQDTHNRSSTCYIYFLPIFVLLSNLPINKNATLLTLFTSIVNLNQHLYAITGCINELSLKTWLLIFKFLF